MSIENDRIASKFVAQAVRDNRDYLKKHKYDVLEIYGTVVLGQISLFLTPTQYAELREGLPNDTDVWKGKVILNNQECGAWMLTRSHIGHSAYYRIYYTLPTAYMALQMNLSAQEVTEASYEGRRQAAINAMQNAILHMSSGEDYSRQETDEGVVVITVAADGRYEGQYQGDLGRWDARFNGHQLEELTERF
jgi:hypothetical protein